MDYDERSIKLFLKSYPGHYVSPRIISRRVGDKRRAHENPLWALPILTRMADKGVVESDQQGHYRLKKPSTDPQKRAWVSPQVQRILERSSKDFGTVHQIGEDLDLAD